MPTANLDNVESADRITAKGLAWRPEQVDVLGREAEVVEERVVLVEPRHGPGDRPPLYRLAGERDVEVPSPALAGRFPDQ